MLPQHVSILPISVGYFTDPWPSSQLPLEVSDSIYFEDVSDIIQGTAFNLLVPMLYSEGEADFVRQTRYALVRHFECDHQDRWNEDRRSAAQLYALYLGLKVVRPTPGRYQVLHYELDQPKPRLPRGERNTYAAIVCDCEGLNAIRWGDLQELASLAPSLLGTLSSALNPISQAVQSLEIGYRADFLNVRHLLWVIGLDALFTSTDWESQGKAITTGRILDFLGSDFKIEFTEASDDFGIGTPEKAVLGGVLNDIYKLRNDFAHGTWPAKEWAGKVCRRSADGSRDIYYAELLSECASATLRACLKKIFADAQLVDLFSEKAKMNAHFASRGLVRSKKK